MPAGPGGSNATVGWMRFYGMTAQAAADKARAANAAKLMEWFGGKADGQYTFQKMIFTDIGTGFGVKSLFQDPDVRKSYAQYSDIAMFERQQQFQKVRAIEGAVRHVVDDDGEVRERFDQAGGVRAHIDQRVFHLLDDQADHLGWILGAIEQRGDVGVHNIG